MPVRPRGRPASPGRGLRLVAALPAPTAGTATAVRRKPGPLMPPSHGASGMTGSDSEPAAACSNFKLSLTPSCDPELELEVGTARGVFAPFGEKRG